MTSSTSWCCSPGSSPGAVVWLRAWFRYLRQTGSSFGLLTVVDALRRAPAGDRGAGRPVLRAARSRRPQARQPKSRGCARSSTRRWRRSRSIDDDRILRRLRALVDAVLRTNAFAPASHEALGVQARIRRLVPGLPAPVPWREIWVYSPRVEGIHLRGGPVARGGLRWSDRRDDFRTEILGLMKAQLVKNAVIVPTGAKGGFYPKMLPPSSHRDAWLAEGTESYRIFIRSLLSVTDNIVDDKVVHPRTGRRSTTATTPISSSPPTRARRPSPTSPTPSRWSADSGSATPSPAAGPTATTTRRWASPPAARGFRSSATSWKWASTCRPTRSPSPASATCRATCSATACCCSKAIKLVAAFDHRHIFIDPNPDPASSWAERKRLFELPRSSWDDYDTSKISAGGGVFPRTPEGNPAVEAGARGAGHRCGQGRSGDADERDPEGAGRPALVRRHRHLRQSLDPIAFRSRRPGQRRAARRRRSICARRSSARARTWASPRPRGSSSPSKAGGSTPTSSTIAPASTAPTRK